MRTLAPPLVVAIALTGAGCKSKETGAREAFAREFTCPEERVDVRERAELKPSMLRERAKPPPEIAADPARLALWNADQDKALASADGHCEMFEARGCDHQALLCCMRPPKHMNRVSCSKYGYANGVSRW